jgi:HEAT repeat protein
VPREVVTALGKIGDPKAVEPLVEVLQDVTSNVRDEAALALGRIGDARAIPVLERVLKDDNKFVREAAEGALQML